MKIFNIFKKKKDKRYNMPKETSITLPILLPITTSIPIPGEPQISREQQFWLNYTNRMKNDNKLKELFPKIIKRLEEDLTKEEIEELIKPIEEYERMERWKKDVFSQLVYEYNKVIEKK